MTVFSTAIFYQKNIRLNMSLGLFRLVRVGGRLIYDRDGVPLRDRLDGGCHPKRYWAGRHPPVKQSNVKRAACYAARFRMEFASCAVTSLAAVPAVDVALTRSFFNA